MHLHFCSLSFPPRFEKRECRKPLKYKAFLASVPFVPRVPRYFQLPYAREIYILLLLSCVCSLYRWYLKKGEQVEHGEHGERKSVTVGVRQSQFQAVLSAAFLFLRTQYLQYRQECVPFLSSCFCPCRYTPFVSPKRGTRSS